MKTLTPLHRPRRAVATLLIFVALVMLFAFFDLIHELGDVGQGGLHAVGRRCSSSRCTLPSRMYELFPVAALIGTLFAMAQLVANSEYTVMRASGASLLQVSWALIRIGIPLALVTFLAGEFVAPPAERLSHRSARAALRRRAAIVAQQFQSGFWFKQDLHVRQHPQRARRHDARRRAHLRVRPRSAAEDGAQRGIRAASSGNGHWQLDQRAARPRSGASRQRASTQADKWAWETVLRPSLLTVYQVAPERLELNTLYDNIRVLGRQPEDVALRDRVLEQGVLSRLPCS